MRRDWHQLYWSEMTWGERVLAGFCLGLAWVLFLGGGILAISLLGYIIEAQTERVMWKEQCLKNAKTGYEYEQCL